MTKLKNILTIALSAIFLLGFCVWGIVEPDGDYLESERRRPQAFPELSWNTVTDGSFMSKFEKYSTDQFPLRNEFRSLKAMVALYVMGRADNNDLYLSDGFIVKQEYPLNEASVERAAGRFEYIYDKHLKDKNTKVYITIVPDKNYFVADETGHLSIDYEALEALLKEKTGFAEYIDIFDKLELEDYYKTDTHWRQEKIIDVARHIASSMGTELKAEYTVNKVDGPFKGVYYGQAALPLDAEDMCYLENLLFDACKVYDYETGMPVETSIYVPEAFTCEKPGDDPYGYFLGGPKKPLRIIENPNATTDKELIIYSDSFGTSIAPLFAEAYSKVILVDIRCSSPDILNRYFEIDGQDVLFLYSSLVLNDSVELK